jgi:cytochrome c
MPETGFPQAAGRHACRAVAALAIGLAAVAAAAQEAPRLGIEATEAEVDGWALSILPDGSGLPAGSGTAGDGAEVYRRSCIACHGIEGQGGPNDQLVGGHGTIASDAPVKTIGSYWPYATTVFDYIRRAMPFTAPQSLSDDEVYAVTAYLLALNGIIDDDFVVDASTLPGIEMPNAGNFFWDYKVAD